MPRRSGEGMNCSFRLCMAGMALGNGACVVAQRINITDEGSVTETLRKLHPGQYVWAPQLALEGKLLFIINLSTQRAILLRNGVPIAASTVSTGRPGRETPTGVFSVLEKQIEHHSSKYDNASMPYMQRLTWRGIALHAGKVPGYPASHGCIRLPPAFAKLLFGVTSTGMEVVVTDRSSDERISQRPDPSVPVTQDTG